MKVDGTYSNHTYLACQSILQGAATHVLVHKAECGSIAGVAQQAQQVLVSETEDEKTVHRSPANWEQVLWGQCSS
jgi:hypothetical protein